MFKRFNPAVIWLIALLLLSLFLAACAGAAQPTPAQIGEASATDTAGCDVQVPCASDQTEQAAGAPTNEPAAQSPATPTEAAAAAPQDSTAPQNSMAAVDCEAIIIPDNPLIAPASTKDWSIGPADAPITLIEYADFQCPGCAGMYPAVKQLKEDYGDNMRLVFRHLPLINLHDKAKLTAEAAEAAGAQGKFWEMQDILFQRQDQWSSTPAATMPETLLDYAKEIGVADLKKFQAALENHTYADKVQADYEAAVNDQLTSTPSFVVNQVDYPAQNFGLSYDGLNAFIKLIELREKWYQQPEQVIDPEKQYTATIKTEKGDIVIELYPDTAPVNVNSFAFLAEQGWYKGVTFHRVLPDFVAQGGDPTGLGIGSPGYRCGDEVVSSRTFDKPGLVALANSGPNTNGSQFFITYAAVPQLNPGFTIIGEVIEGMDIAEEITPRDPQSTPNAPPGDKIVDITITEKS